MKSVVWEDADGKLHRSLVFDSDPDEAAPQGVPQDPPPLNIDWGEVEKAIHNHLVEQGVTTWEDVQAGQNRVTSILLSVIRRQIIHSFRSATNEHNANAE
jgi:hypothetical protein